MIWQFLKKDLFVENKDSVFMNGNTSVTNNLTMSVLPILQSSWLFSNATKRIKIGTTTTKMLISTVWNAQYFIKLTTKKKKPYI